MIIIYLLAISLINSIYLIIVKIVQKKYVSSNLHIVFFNLMICSIQVMLLFIMPPYYNYRYNSQTVFLGWLFAMFFLMGYLFLIIAFSKGALSLTNLVSNLNMIVPILLGIFIWNEKISIKQFSGMGLMFLAIFLISNISYSEQNIKKKADCKWMIMAICSSLFTGLSITISKHHAILRPDNPKEFLIIYNLFCVVITGAISLYYKFYKNQSCSFKRDFYIYSLLASLLMTVSNIIYMLIVGKLDSVLFFPVLKVTSFIFILLASNIFFREKFEKKAFVGITAGIVSIFLLSI